MGMQNTIKIAIELKQLGLFNNLESLIDMGAQELHMTRADFDFVMKYGGIGYDKADFPNLNYPGSPRQKTKPFWEALGFKQVDCLDYNKHHGSIYCDLNFPFEQKEYLNKYDVVTDFGNNEHPCNVVEAYRTMHRLCAKNGLMWIHQDIINGNGFFNFDLSFFECMAAANKYNICYNSFVITTQDKHQHHIPMERSILDLFDFGKLKHIGVNYIFRKTSEEDFKYFYQGSVDINNRDAYKIQFLSKRFPPERYYIPTKPNYGTIALFNMLTKRIKKSLLRKIRIK